MGQSRLFIDNDLSRKYREKILDQLAHDSDFAAMVEAIRTSQNGGTFEVTVSSRDRVKSVGARLRIEKQGEH